MVEPLLIAVERDSIEFRAVQTLLMRLDGANMSTQWTGNSLAGGRFLLFPALHAFVVHVCTTSGDTEGDFFPSRIHVLMTDRALTLNRLSAFL
jgi:hypothetical protein